MLPRTLLLAATLIAGSATAQQEYRLSVDAGAYRLDGGAPKALATPEAPSRFNDRPFAEVIQAAAREAQLEPALVHAVIEVESAYNPKARSEKGAIGLMQLMPATAARYGVRDPARSPEENLRAGTRYLSELIELFDGRLELALAAYNAGENAVIRHGHRVPPYRETLKYVPLVLEKYREWREPQPVTPPAPRPIEYLPGTRLGQQD